MAKGKKREQNDSEDNTQQQGPSFPLVGIGASAGGLDALKEFFAAVEPDNGMAYVVVVHMAPDHTSSMPQIVGRVARIPVAEAKDGERIQPDHVYFAPPGKEVCVYDGAIQLIERSDSSPTLTIDPFLRSLAADAGKKAAAVILSGTGGDGSGGVKEVKANDGLVLVQSRDTAEYAGMPNSAVATGVVDMEMKPGAMPAVLVQHFSTERAIATQSVDEQAEQSGKWLPKVFAVIRSQVGHDFAGYKRSTLLRRIHRRMALQRIEDPQEYVDLLHKDRSEVETLFREFLIGVTHFFRDSESFDALRDQALPSLLEEFEQGSTLRVWVAGCSTGEEAYSVAMVIHEALDRMPEKRITFQIFATDIDSWAIQKARGAVYPVSIAADMSEERLKRFFVKESDSFRVRKEIRESVIFSVQDVLRDPPFSRLHLLCCRNLLIYLERPQQDRLLRLFHYTLRPQGILMLGTSESVGGLTRLFGALDAQTKLYRRNEVPDSVRGRVDFPTNSTGTSQGPEPAPSQPAKRKENLGELTREALLSNFGPTGVLIDQEGTIIHVQGRTGTYLEHTTGPATHNILDMAREGLRLELSAAIRSARASSESVTHRGVTVQTNGETERIDVSVKRLSAPVELEGRLLVVFSKAARQPSSAREDQQTEAAEALPEEERANRIRQLEQELNETRENHQYTVEELGSANDGLRYANEEMQSSNEELQSTNEELESSKEELQSLNEELNTVNSELQNNVEALTAANDDMRNLLNSTEVATIFVDNDLNIRRFTDRAAEIVNLIEGDVGRPLRHVSTNLSDDRLLADVEEVIDKLSPVEREVTTDGDEHFQLRVTPYRTADNRIDGAVISFSEITVQKQAQERLEQLNAEKQHAVYLARKVIDMNPQPLVVLNDDRTIVFANDAFGELVEADGSLEGRNLLELDEAFDSASDLRSTLDHAAEAGEDFGGMALTVGAGNGTRNYRISGRIVPWLEGERYRILLGFAEEPNGEDHE